VTTKENELVEGFNLVPDFLIQDVGHTAALVWARIYRFSRKKNYSYASQERIAEELNLDRSTVHRHIEILLEKGYLIDMTPKRKFKPHEYVPNIKLINARQNEYLNEQKLLREKRMEEFERKLAEKMLDFDENEDENEEDQEENYLKFMKEEYGI
jgi:biotin operon repressor